MFYMLKSDFIPLVEFSTQLSRDDSRAKTPPAPGTMSNGDEGDRNCVLTVHHGRVHQGAHVRDGDGDAGALGGSLVRVGRGAGEVGFTLADDPAHVQLHVPQQGLLTAPLRLLFRQRCILLRLQLWLGQGEGCVGLVEGSCQPGASVYHQTVGPVKREGDTGGAQIEKLFRNG